MTRRLNLWLLIALAGVIVALATESMWGGYLESDYQRGTPRVVPRPTPVPPPPPEPTNEVTALLDDLAIDSPYHYRGLTIFPLVLRHRPDHRSYQTLDEGLANGTVVVKERKGGVVSELVLRNNAGLHTFILAGELVLGGKQNRLMRSDLLLPPHSGDVVVAVYCGQKGRWSPAERFTSKSALAPQALRGRAMAGAPQAEVWEGIRKNAARLKAASPSEDLQRVYDSKAVRTALAEYRDRCVPYLRRRSAVGFVAARYGAIVGAEVFRSRSLFNRLRSKLIESYAIDCIGWEPAHWRRRPVRQPTVAQARAFLNRAYHAQISIGSTPGAGRLLTLSGRSTGQALAFDRACVHLSLYQPAPIIIRPLPPRPPVVPMPRHEERD